MTVVVAYDNKNVSEHFGETKEFKIYEIENNKIISSKIEGNQGKSHKELVGLVNDFNANILICGRLGDGGRNLLDDLNIKYYPGVKGDADKAVMDLLNDCLDYDLAAKCNHASHH